MGDEVYKESNNYELMYINVNSGTSSIPTATVSVKYKEKEFSDSATGDGPVDALFNAIDRAIKKKFKIESYSVRSVTSGRQAMGEVVVRMLINEKRYSGRGVSTDILEASAKAYLSAINQNEIFINEAEKIKSQSSITEVI